MVSGCFLLLMMLPGGEDASSPAERSRAALRRGGYPWYDAETDSIRALAPRESERNPSGGWELPNGASFLAGVARVVAFTLLGVLIAVVVFVIVRYFLNRRDTAVTHERRKSQPAPVHYDALPTRSRGNDLLQDATEAVERGDLQAAIVFYYSHVLVSLHRAGVIFLAKGKTNRQYGREVETRLSDERSAFDAIRQLFEAAYFGGYDVPRDAFTTIWKDRERLLARVEAKR